MQGTDGWAVFVHICRVCGVLTDFLQICLEILCALCCVLLFPRKSHYVDIFICSKLADL